MAGLRPLPPPPIGDDENMGRWFQQVQSVVNNLCGSASYYKYVPSGSGFTAVIPQRAGLLLIASTTTLAAGSVTLPAQAQDGLTVDIIAMAAVTSASVAVASGSGSTIAGAAVTTFAAGVTYRYLYAADVNIWYRVQ